MYDLQIYRISYYRTDHFRDGISWIVKSACEVFDCYNAFAARDLVRMHINWEPGRILT